MEGYRVMEEVRREEGSGSGRRSGERTPFTDKEDNPQDIPITGYGFLVRAPSQLRAPSMLHRLHATAFRLRTLQLELYLERNHRCKLDHTPWCIYSTSSEPRANCERTSSASPAYQYRTYGVIL